MDAPKTAIYVGLQDDYKLRCKLGHGIAYNGTNGHENMMSIEMEEDKSSDTSFNENSQTSQENENSVNSLETLENCCTSYGYDINDDHDQHHLHHQQSVNVGDNEDVCNAFDNDEFIIVPHAAQQQQLITSHCNLHSGLMILTHHDSELASASITSDSCNSSPAPSSCTANTTNSSAEFNYNFATAAAANDITTNVSCYKEDIQQHYQCFMQKCAH